MRSPVAEAPKVPSRHPGPDASTPTRGRSLPVGASRADSHSTWVVGRSSQGCLPRVEAERGRPPQGRMQSADTKTKGCLSCAERSPSHQQRRRCWQRRLAPEAVSAKAAIGVSERTRRRWMVTQKGRCPFRSVGVSEPSKRIRLCADQTSARAPCMPGVVSVSVWKQRISPRDSFELLASRTFAVFGVTPGMHWSGFESFVRSLANEYGTKHVQLLRAPPASSDSATGEASLLAQPDLLKSFVFPAGGALDLVFFVPLLDGDHAGILVATGTSR